MAEIQMMELPALADAILFSRQHNTGGTPVPKEARMKFMLAVRLMCEEKFEEAEQMLLEGEKKAAAGNDQENTAILMIGQGYFAVKAKRNAKAGAEKYIAAFETFRGIAGAAYTLAPLAAQIAAIYKAVGEQAAADDWLKRAQELDALERQ